MDTPARVATLTGVLATITLVVSGCSSAATPAAELSGSWSLESAADSAGTIDLLDADVTLTIGDSSSGGRAPCNSYFLTLTGGPGAVAVSGLGNTELACADAELMTVEARYLSALSAVTDAVVASDELVLTSENGTELRYTAN